MSTKVGACCLLTTDSRKNGRLHLQTITAIIFAPFLQKNNFSCMALFEKKLEIKKSVLPGAGKGLFAKELIPKGSRIVEYKGKITTWKEVDDNDGANVYIYYVKRHHVIDASRRTSVLARYANDARGLQRIKGIRNNAEYVEEGLKVYIESSKDIAAGAEILVEYGKEYWDVIRHNIKVEEQRQNSGKGKSKTRKSNARVAMATGM
ncbi:MAG: SET domain-containing protein [Bacteroidota bacterium]|nr:SET domain-containing protein [Bacteroidota bacterium]